jgi:hypothetical protein
LFNIESQIFKKLTLLEPRLKFEHVSLLSKVAEAESVAALGEVAVSPDAFNVLSTVFDFREAVEPTNTKPVIIASRSECHFTIKRGFQPPLIPDNVTAASELKGEISLLCESLDFEELMRLRLMISLYVHPVVAKDELATELSH